MAVLVTGSNKLRVTSAVQCSDQCTVLNQADRVRPQDSWCGFGIKWWLLCWQKNTRKKYDISRDIFKDPLGKSKFTFSANESVTARRCCDQSANQRPVFAPLNDQGVFPPRSHADWNSLTRVCCHLSPAEDAEDGRDGGSSLEFRSITLYFYSCNKTLIHNIMDSCPSTEGMRHSISDPKVWAPTDFPGCNPRPGRAGGPGLPLERRMFYSVRQPGPAPAHLSLVTTDSGQVSSSQPAITVQPPLRRNLLDSTLLFWSQLSTIIKAISLFVLLSFFSPMAYGEM